jgi:hypothetical protein
MSLVFIVIGTLIMFIAAFAGGWLLAGAIDNRVGTRPSIKIYLYAFLKGAIAAAAFWALMIALAMALEAGFHAIF